MGLRRGFKSEANWYARSLRQELGLAPYSPLCPWKLAEHLGFQVFPLAEFAEAIPHEVTHLRGRQGQAEFSAVTLCAGSDRLIIHNDAHHKKRQAANIAHELSHGLLIHPSRPLLDDAGGRHYDAAIEEEANWLGPALLISEEAALLIVERKYSVSEASDLYGASEEVVRMRLNVTGAHRRLKQQAA